MKQIFDWMMDVDVSPWLTFDDSRNDAVMVELAMVITRLERNSIYLRSNQKCLNYLNY
jgi:hypothetical protein